MTDTENIKKDKITEETLEITSIFFRDTSMISLPKLGHTHIASNSIWSFSHSHKSNPNKLKDKDVEMNRVDATNDCFFL